VDQDKAGAVKDKGEAGDKEEDKEEVKEEGKARAAWAALERAAWPGTVFVQNAGTGNRISVVCLAWSRNALSAGPR